MCFVFLGQTEGQYLKLGADFRSDSGSDFYLRRI